MLNDAQLQAVRWYIGDVEGNDPFWGDPKVYVTINALFFPGIAAEQARAAEGKRLNPAVAEDPARLLETLRNLLEAFRPLPEAVMTYRVERYADYRMMAGQGSRTLSFTSTSTAGFLSAYQDRCGIALMRFSLPAGTPAIDMSRVLPHYAKPDEAEILLPPFLHLAMEERPLTAQELQMTDADGKPPLVSVSAVPDGMTVPATAEQNLPDNTAAVRVLRELDAGRQPDAADAAAYCAWKSALTRRSFALD